MIVAGIDIGSTACKAVVLDGRTIVASAIGPSTASPARQARDIYERALASCGVPASAVARVVGTGYGRALVPFADQNVSELTCHGRGAAFAVPQARTVLDIGGQDTKAISIDDEGFLVEYAMNDKCAAGTGRFLEAMSRSLDLSLDEMGAMAAAEVAPCAITSLCSVFAETEVINLVNEGVEVTRIVKGLFESMANRVASLARRVGVVPEVVVTGGVAKSQTLATTLAARLGVELTSLPPGVDPQVVGALGAAVAAIDEAEAADG